MITKFEQFNEGLFTKPKLKYKVGDYVIISTVGWIDNHIAPKMPPSFIAKIVAVDDRPLLNQYADLKSKWIVTKRTLKKKIVDTLVGAPTKEDKIFPYIVEFIDDSKGYLCDDDISSVLDNEEKMEEFELEKSAKKYNL